MCFDFQYKFVWNITNSKKNLARYQRLYCPTNALNCMNCGIIKKKKNIKNLKSSPTCFGSRRNYHQEAKVSA